MRISLIILTLIFTTFAFQGRAAEMPRFFEETKSAGIDHTYSGKFEYMGSSTLEVEFKKSCRA